MDVDLEYLHRAIRLAREAGRVGNLPVGAVISLDGEVVAEGKNSIWVPKLSPSRHAEIEALEAVPPELLRARAEEMTLYTTLRDSCASYWSCRLWFQRQPRWRFVCVWPHAACL